MAKISANNNQHDLYREAWKWLLEHLSDKEILRIAQRACIHVRGFRQPSIEHLIFLRPMLIKEMVTNSQKILVTFANKVEGFDYVYENRKKQVGDFQVDTILDVAEAASIVFSFLTSRDPRKIDTGLSLYEQFISFNQNETTSIHELLTEQEFFSD
jgi:hypothetical protein